MPLLETKKNDDDGTNKPTMRFGEGPWIPSIHFHETDENQISFIAETMDERFVLDIWVTNREAAVEAFDKLFTTLQELQIED